MPKGGELSKEKRAVIIDRISQGCSFREIERLGLASHRTASRIWKRFVEDGQVCSKKRSGRPKCTTARQDRHLTRLCLQDRTASSFALRRDVLEADGNISARTVRRRLVQFGLRSRRPAKKPLLSKKNLKDRLKFCRLHKDWTADDWAKVVFSDESPFSCFANRGGIRVRRRPGERYKLICTLPTIKHPETVHVWGCFSARGIGALRILPKGTSMNSQWYVNTLDNYLLPTLHSHFAGEECYFQDDGAPCHRAKVVKAWLAEERVSALPFWPGNSPDLNPIENLWGVMGALVRQKQPRNRTELENSISFAWASPQIAQHIQSLVDSMPRRIAAVLKNKGQHCKY